MTDSQSASGDHAPVLEATEARQGRRGKHALWILVISLVLGVVALLAAWRLWSPHLAGAEPNAPARTAAATMFDSQEPASDLAPAGAAPAADSPGAQVPPSR